MNDSMVRNAILGAGLAAALFLLGSFYSVVQGSVDRSGSLRPHVIAVAPQQR